MQPYGCYESTYPAFRWGTLFLDAFLGQILIIHHDRLGDVAIPQVNDGRSAKQRC